LNQISQYEFEFIIVDDEPMDKTAMLLKKFNSDIRVKVIHQYNREFSGTINHALKVYNRRLIFVDPDNNILLNAIQNLLKTELL